MIQISYIHTKTLIKTFAYGCQLDKLIGVSVAAILHN